MFKKITGQDCFSISVLHLLAQTDLISRLTICNKDHLPKEIIKPQKSELNSQDLEERDSNDVRSVINSSHDYSSQRVTCQSSR